MTEKSNVEEFLNELVMKNAQDDDVQEVQNPKSNKSVVQKKQENQVKKLPQKLKLDSVEKPKRTRANVPKAKPDTEKQKPKKESKVEDDNSDDEKPFQYVSYKRQFVESESSDDEDEEKTEHVRYKRESSSDFDELKRKIDEIDESCGNLGKQQNEFGRDLYEMQQDISACRKICDKLERKHKKLQKQENLMSTMARTVAFLDLDHLKRCIASCGSPEQIKYTIGNIFPRQQRLLINILGESKANSLTKPLMESPDAETFWKTAANIEAELNDFDLQKK